MGLLATIAPEHAAPTRADAEPATLAAAMRSAAKTFLQRLDRPRRREATRPYSDPGRVRWSGFPGARVGVAWGRLDAAQREAATALLRTGLSEQGLELLAGIRTLEGILRQAAARTLRRNPSWRDPGLYHLAVFGVPAPKATWAWRIEGHHVSWTFTVAGERVAITPRFQGADPASVPRGPRQGLRVLGAYEDVARRFVQGLDDARRARAVVSARADPMPNPSGSPDLSRVPRRGIALAALDEAQRARLWAIVDTWTAVLHPALARAERERARALRPGALTFAWTGSLDPRAACGYRLHGDTLYIAFGRSANHVHSLWRDPRGDFGRAPVAAQER